MGLVDVEYDIYKCPLGGYSTVSLTVYVGSTPTSATNLCCGTIDKQAFYYYYVCRR